MRRAQLTSEERFRGGQRAIGSPMTKLLLTLLTLPLAPLVVGHPPEHRIGVCQGIHRNMSTENLLSGRHLQVLEYEWPAFAEKDPSAPQGWVGLDIDMLNIAANRLNFTYTLVELVLEKNESWDAMVQRMAPKADLVLSYWGRTPEYLRTLRVLTPHVDYSSVLVVRSDALPAMTWVEQMLRFAAPFSWQVWLAFIAMIVISGIMDYFLEMSHGGSVRSSIYEYAAEAHTVHALY